MAKKPGTYKCETCGNIVEVLHAGDGDLFCCGVDMELLVPNSVDAATEKHVPVIECTEEGIKVSVGSTLHPMTEEHYIEWIAIVVDGRTIRQDLSPGDEPVVIFKGIESSKVKALAYCNLHGLWKSACDEGSCN